MIDDVSAGDDEDPRSSGGARDSDSPGSKNDGDGKRTRKIAGERIMHIDPPVNDAALSPTIQAQIGRRLLAVYDEVLQQPIPDRFRILLDHLDQKFVSAEDVADPDDTEKGRKS